MASTFYASADGTVFHPVSDEARRCAHDGAAARSRLTEKLARRKQRQQQAQSQEPEGQPADAAGGGGGGGGGGADGPETPAAHAEYVSPAPGDPNNDDSEIAIRRIEQRLQTQAQRQKQLEERKHNRGLAEDARFFRGNSKAIPSNYVRKVDHADNKHARAIVHHTGSHYVMAGSRQFQRGVRVKGVVSRHSKQGARLQAARVSKQNAMGAREDARGERAQGSRSLGKQGGKKKKKNRKGNKAP